jgi:hypothetical protein
MLLASNIGFLALVGPAQMFIALSFDPQRDMQSNDEYKSFIVKGIIYQCLINTYYAASFVFCFASSSIFRREIRKLLNRQYKPKHSLITATNELYSPQDSRPFLQQARLSGTYCTNGSPNSENIFERKQIKRGTESTIEADGFF